MARDWEKENHRRNLEEAAERAADAAEANARALKGLADSQAETQRNIAAESFRQMERDREFRIFWDTLTFDQKVAWRKKREREERKRLKIEIEEQARIDAINAEEERQKKIDYFVGSKTSWASQIAFVTSVMSVSVFAVSVMGSDFVTPANIFWVSFGAAIFELLLFVVLRYAFRKFTIWERRRTLKISAMELAQEIRAAEDKIKRLGPNYSFYIFLYFPFHACSYILCLFL